MFVGLVHSSEGCYPIQSQLLRLIPVWAPAFAEAGADYVRFSLLYCYCEPIAKIAGKMMLSPVEFVRIGA